MIYTITFNPALDYFVRLPELLIGEVNRCAGETIQFGGKGINVSCVLHELDVPSIALGFTAGFTGEALKDSLAAQGIQTDFIPLESGLTRINVKIKAETETELNTSGPHISTQALDALFERLDALSETDVLVLAGSIPNSLPSNIYQRILARVAPRGITCVVDATGELLVKVLEYRPFLIKPNNHELGEIFGKTLQNDQQIIACAKRLQQMGARNVLVSMAGDGCLLLDETGKTHRLAAFKGKVQSSVGAGDSMVAGFLAGWLGRGDYAWALRLGSVCGSATAFSQHIATRSKIDELLNSES